MVQKFFFTFLAVLILSVSGTAQTFQEIRTSGSYNWGIGVGSNYSHARRNALESLTESISVHIKSEFEHIIKETNDNVDEYAKSVVTSYSSAVINNYEERVLKEEQGNVEVLVFITKKNLQEVFKQREQIIGDFILQGVRAESEFRISDALRYYYWALVLTRSHPDNSKLRHNFSSQQDEPVMIGLYDRINRIFSLLKFDIVSVTEQQEPKQKQFHLNITYRNNPVTDLDYTYWVGDGYSSQISIRDGRGIAIIEGQAASELTNLRLRVEYQYNNKAHLEPEVKLMMESVTLPYFERAEVRIPLSVSQNPKVATSTSRAFTNIESNMPEYAIFENALKEVSTAIRTRNHLMAKPLFTSEGFEIYTKLINNGRVSILDQQLDTLKIIRFGNETMVRFVPMLFSFHNNRNRFIENVVFTFNSDNKISNVSFALGQIATNDILNKPTGFGTLEEKYFLIQFMENYKTAYALKRLDYLEAIFDENALIIVGNVVKRTEEPTDRVKLMYGNLSNEEVEYIVLSKGEYMERLKRVFGRNEFINIHFEDNQVRKTQRDDKIYGIQIAQHYHSSTYADKGYLFLMIDLNDTLQPKIYVRSWQPQKNPDGSIFGLEDFRF
ncbi:MAG: hypothetical protein RBT74_09060 [Tenuifilaceae bacterium]|jgi:hypothetical protein|nr:hypothetical protein [Tenuifilaceae bacterium]